MRERMYRHAKKRIFMIRLSGISGRKMKRVTLVLLLCGLMLSTCSAGFRRALEAGLDSLSPVHGSVSASDVDWWPMFHHDPSHSGYSTSEAPDTNETSWSYKIPGGASADIVSSPAIADGKVFVGSQDTKVYCLDAASGAYIWDHPTGGFVESSPVVADGRVHVSSWDNLLYCLDEATGAYIWSYPISTIVTSSPAVAYGKVYEGSGERVICLDAATGAFIWDFSIPSGPMFSSPAVADGRVYVGSTNAKFYCLDAFTGALIWIYTAGGGFSQYGSAAVAYGKLYRGSFDRKVYCLDAATGAFIWSSPTGFYVESSPAVADGKVFVGSDDTKVYCLDAFTGAFIWSYKTGDYVQSSSAIADGIVYVGSNDGFVYAFGPDWWLTRGHDASRSEFSTSKGPTTNETLWTYRVGTLPPEDQYTERIQSSPAVAYGKVYFGACDNKTYCLDAATGTLEWCFNPLDAFPTHKPSRFNGATVADGKVYITADGGQSDTYWHYFYRLDAATGDCDWTYQESPSLGFAGDSPIVVDGLLFIRMSWYGIRVFNITTGQSWWIGEGILGPTRGFAVCASRVYVTHYSAAYYHVSCYDYLGHPLWSYQISTPYYEEWVNGPVVVDGRVYAAARIHQIKTWGLLYCLNAYDGSELWPPKIVGAIGSDPAVAYGKVYMVSMVSGYPDRLYCYDALTGADIWASSYVSGQRMLRSPVVAGGKVYIECEESDYQYTFHCYNATTGERVWRYKSATNYGSLHAWESAVSGGRVYAPVGRDMICYGHNPQLHLESVQDIGASSNLGIITFDDATYSLPSDISTTPGNYQTQYNSASSSYLFDHWETTGELRVSNPYTNPTAVTARGDGTLRAVYKAHVHTINASAGSGGSISPSGSVPVNYGDDITFAITPDVGFHIKDIVVDTVSVGAVPSYTFTNVINDHSITANFAINQYTITASAEPGGSISPSGSVPVNHGQDKTFTITANPGYDILDVVVDGTDHQGAISSYTFHYVTADHSISAFFGSDHDIAVIDVTPSRTSVGRGNLLLIDVTVENHGIFTESFNLTVYYGSSTITPEQWETFWSLGDVNRDGYINMTDMNLLSAAYMSTPSSPNWNPWADLNQDLKVNTFDITICAYHQGLKIWTYFMSGGVIQTLPVINLAAGSIRELTFTWDTSNIPYGNYIIGAYAVPIMGTEPPLGKEVDRADNTLADGAIFVTIPGDITGPENPVGSGLYPPDGVVDNYDLSYLRDKYGTNDPIADFTGPAGKPDGIVDAYDLRELGKNYGKHV